jgi:hypothetical protein
MNVVFAAVGTLALTASLVACGDTSRPALEPDLAAKPTWGGCSEFSQQAMSIAAGTPGSPTLVAAITDDLEYGDHVMTAPQKGGLKHRWLVAADGTIRVDL